MNSRPLFAILTLPLVSALGIAQINDTTSTQKPLPTPYLAALNGTYTFSIATPNLYSVEYNNLGQQVGFCNSGQLPWAYSCSQQLGQDVLTGTFTADGNGNITSGTFALRADPNTIACSPKNNPAADCPYPYPASTPWSASVSYAIGDVVIYNGVSIQAIKAGLGNPPNGTGNLCTANTPYNLGAKCYWVQLYGSAAAQNSSGSGTLTGSYGIQASGLGHISFTATEEGKDHSESALFSIIVPANAAGQEVTLIGAPTLGNQNSGSGTAIRQ